MLKYISNEPEDYDFSYFNDKNQLFNENTSIDETDNFHQRESSGDVNSNFIEISNKIILIKNNNNDLVSNFVKKLNIDSAPFIPKNYLNNMQLYNDPNVENNPLNYNKRNINFNKKKTKKNKKEKKKYVEKEGDWPCYKCKNINFAFRDKCNKCYLSKEDSEQKYIEAGKNLMKLFNKSTIEKKKYQKSIRA